MPLASARTGCETALRVGGAGRPGDLYQPRSDDSSTACGTRRVVSRRVPALVYLATVAFTFVDLFAGIGGFHVALGERWDGLGGHCVLASELDREARRVYRDNLRMPAKGDIRKVIARHHGEPVRREDELDDLLSGPAKLPEQFDLLAAGFPCQPFSKSGRQEGLEDQTRGTLFFDICTILQERKPRFIVLENVRNIAAHDSGRTWQVIVDRLHELGYKVNSTPLVFSPHLLHPSEGGAPQFRERVFILGEHKDYNAGMGLDWSFYVPNRPPSEDWMPEFWNLKQWLKQYPALEEDLGPYRWPEVRQQQALAWGELLSKLPKGRVPQPLKVYAWKSDADLFDERGEALPAWKQRHNLLNARFFDTHGDLLKPWVAKHRPLEWIKSNQKFEWQAQDALREEPEDIFNLQIQFRPSGVRVKKPTYTGALVAITQTPYMGWLKRSLTPTEAASLQGIPVHDDADPYRLHKTPAVAFKQLGNGVNSGVVRYLVERLFKHCGFSDYQQRTAQSLDPAAYRRMDLDDLVRTVVPASGPASNTSIRD